MRTHNIDFRGEIFGTAPDNGYTDKPFPYYKKKDFVEHPLIWSCANYSYTVYYLSTF